MNLTGKKKLGVGLILGLTSLSLMAQNATPFGNLPLWFEAGAPVDFVAHANGSEFAISPAGVKFTLTQNSGQTSACQLSFVGASPEAHISGVQELTGKINYLLGNNSKQWQSGIATFAQVRAENIYPGVNVVYYGNQQKLEYDFNLAAGVNPAIIALRFDGAEKISLNRQGELVIRLRHGEIVQHAPVAYQIIHGVRQEISAGYKILDAQTAGFALGHFTPSEPLVIDPVLSFSTYYGGNFNDKGWAIAVNPTDGSIYVAGQTFSSKFKTGIPFSTPGALQTNYHGGSLSGDAFVARFDASGSNLIYATYLGGSGNDSALGLAVDSTGNAYVTGYTDSTDFPTKNALYSHVSGGVDKYAKSHLTDAFVAELNPAGNALIYSTYLGGSSMDAAYGIALDDLGNAYITGYTYSPDFPVTTNAFQRRLACPATFYVNANAFVAEISPGGTNLNYSTYLGGTNFDVGHAIAFNHGRLFVAGRTTSTNFPSRHALAGFDQLNGSAKKYGTTSDAFVTAFDTSITNLTVLYSTLLGGSNYDTATGIAVDANGSAYVCGYSGSRNFPNTATNISGLNTNILLTNAFLTRIDWIATNATTAIGYSALFGGKGTDMANGVALDPAGNAYVVGSTASLNFPVTTNNVSGFLTTKNPIGGSTNNTDAFVIAFNPNASALLYSACLGGKGNEFGTGIAVDPLGNAYIVGQTWSTNFPTVNARQGTRNNTNDMFLAKISQVVSVVPTLVIASENKSVLSAHSKTAVPAAASQATINLKWQMFPANSTYSVENSTDLTANSWRRVPTSPAYSNGWYNVSLPTTNGLQFFRLRQP